MDNETRETIRRTAAKEAATDIRDAADGSGWRFVTSMRLDHLPTDEEWALYRREYAVALQSAEKLPVIDPANRLLRRSALLLTVAGCPGGTAPGAPRACQPA